MRNENIGGYENGYRCSKCFWGTSPGSLVREYFHDFSLEGQIVLDAGCGEGKNAIYLARQRARVIAIDISESALNNAREAWHDSHIVEWKAGDIEAIGFEDETFHAVVSYGLLHCLSSPAKIAECVTKLKRWTRPGGVHVVCAFNSRHQELHAHPDFRPTLMTHDEILQLYEGWVLLYQSDQNLTESHPNNGIVHTHSLTRLIAKKGAA